MMSRWVGAGRGGVGECRGQAGRAALLIAPLELLSTSSLHVIQHLCQG